MTYSQRRRVTRLDRLAHTIRDINTITREIARLAPAAALALIILAVAIFALVGCTEHALTSTPAQSCPAGTVRVHLASGWECEK